MTRPQPIERPPGYWAAKARALLLPSLLEPLTDIGEAERANKVLEWLGPDADWRDREFFDRCHRDARGVHVPDELEPFRPKAPRDDNEEVPLPPLSHPLGGYRPPAGKDLTPRLADLRRHHDLWLEALLDKRKPPQDADSYNRLWRDWLSSARALEQPWLTRIPGHPLVPDHTVFAQRTIAAALAGARYEQHSRACVMCVHCGPVQSFISAARRTTDLWLGSYIVNFLAYQAVRSIALDCGPDSILYPHLATLPLAELDASPDLERDLEQRLPWLRSAQPNRFVAIVDSTHATSIAQHAARAVYERWQRMAQSVINEILSKLEFDLDSFHQQIDEHLDIDIVVQRWPDTAEQLSTMLTFEQAERDGTDDPPPNVGEFYQDVFRVSRQALAAQRGLRTFVPRQGDERTKCTQCGIREQIGMPKHGRAAATRAWWKQLRNSFRNADLEFREGEQLCAVCLTKRFVHRFDFGGQDSKLGLSWDNTDTDRVALRFPSVASIASAPFRQRLAKYAGHPSLRAWLEALNALTAKDALDFDHPGNLLPGLGPIGRQQNILSCEGAWLYPRSYELDTALRDHPIDESASQRVKERLADAEEAFRRVRAAIKELEGEPIQATSYYAVIKADVNSMGKWLEGQQGHCTHWAGVLAPLNLPRELRSKYEDIPRPITSAMHAEISRRQGLLSTDTLPRIVETDNLGRVVYSGGDDLLAFVPLHTLWQCLDMINRAFQADDALGRKLTVRAGVVISDWRTPLSLALEKARKAERRAKGLDDGGVAVTLDVRSGAPIQVDLEWDLAGRLPSLVEGLTSVTDSTSLLLHPNIVDRLRRELDILKHPGLEQPFRERVIELFGVRDRQPPQWLKARFDQRERELKAGGLPTTGQIVELLLLLRFLDRERRGIPFPLFPPVAEKELP